MRKILDWVSAKRDVKSKSLVEETLDMAHSIDNNRTISDILTHLVSEVGELAQEVIIKEGRSYKDPSEDGLTGEALDIIICALDIIYITDPYITEEELTERVLTKLDKWKRTTFKG